MKNIIEQRLQRRRKVKAVISGTAQKPRLSVFRSNKYIHLQLIDDSSGKVLVSASTYEIKKDKKSENKKSKIEEAFEAGELLAKRAIESKIKTAVFDRRFYKYHGRVGAVAEGARKAGLII